MASPQDSLHASNPLPQVDATTQAEQPVPAHRSHHGRTASQSSAAQVTILSTGSMPSLFFLACMRPAPAARPCYPIWQPALNISLGDGAMRVVVGRAAYHAAVYGQTCCAQEARSDATATPADSLYEMEHANGRGSAGGEGRRSADSGGGGGIPRTRGPERGMLKSPSSGSLSALARGGDECQPKSCFHPHPYPICPDPNSDPRPHRLMLQFDLRCCRVPQLCCACAMHRASAEGTLSAQNRGLWA